MLALPSHVLDGKKIDPKPATPKAKSKEAKSRKIFVGGVSQDTSAEEVKKYFNQYGEARHDLCEVTVIPAGLCRECGGRRHADGSDH